MRRISLRKNFSFVQQDDMVTTLSLIHISGAEQDSHLLVGNLLLNDAPQFPPRDGIDAHTGFIQQKQLGRMDQGAGQTKLLLHAAGELSCQPFAERTECCHGQ